MIRTLAPRKNYHGVAKAKEVVPVPNRRNLMLQTEDERIVAEVEVIGPVLRRVEPAEDEGDGQKAHHAAAGGGGNVVGAQP